MYRFTVALMGALLLVFYGAPHISAQSDCLPSPLIVGDYARVTLGSANNLRDSASGSGTLLVTIPEGHVVTVLDEPTCINGLMWVNVEYDMDVNDKITGWTVESINGEYALEPFPIRMENTVGYPHIKVALPENVALTQDSPRVFGPAYWNHRNPLEFATPHYAAFYTDGIGSASGSPGSMMFRFYPMTPYLARFEPYNQSLDGLKSVLESYRNGKTLTPSEISTLMLQPDSIGFIARPRFMEFDGGIGIRYVQFIQGPGNSTYPIRDHDISYNFIGQTNDGTYIVRISSDIKSIEGFPQYEWRLMGETYRGHVNEVRGVVEALDSTAFTPSLPEIDSIIASISVTPGQNKLSVEVEMLDEIVEASDAGIAAEDLSYVCGLVPRLESGGLARQALDTDSLRVRDVADGVATAFNVFPGETVRVLEGPKCVKGRSWWRIEPEDGAWNGWVAEGDDNDYFFEPTQ